MSGIRVETLLGPAEFRLPRDLRDAACVVFDVLRATTVFVTALASGASGIRPVRTIEEALAWRARLPEALLGGERVGERPPGFDLGNSPAEYAGLSGRELICTTTNGTLALAACAGAGAVHAASLLNLGACAEAVRAVGFERVVLVCAGTGDDFALEDGLAAGAFALELGAASADDATRAMSAAYRDHRDDLAAAFESSKNGRALVASGRRADIAWALRRDAFPIVARMEHGRLVRTEMPG